MSGKPDDSAAGGRRVGQAEGRRTRRSDGRHAKPRGSEAEDAPELSLPEPEDDDPTTLAEDAQWAAKLRPGRAPGLGDTSQAPPSRSAGAAWDDDSSASGSWQRPTGPTTSGSWSSAPSDRSGEIWADSPSETTGDPWSPSSASRPPAAGPWASGTAEPSTGDWSAGIAAMGRQPGQRLSDLRYERPSAPGVPAGHDPGTGSWGVDPDTTGGWQRETPWSPGRSDRPSWEEPPAATTSGLPYQATPGAEPPAARPWETPPPRRSTPATPASTEPNFGSIFSDLAQDRQAEAPAPHGQAPLDSSLHDEDPAVQAAHMEARRLIEHATGQLFQSQPTTRWEQDEPPRTRADEFAEPAMNYGTGSPGSQPRTDPAGGAGFGPPSSYSPGGPAHDSTADRHGPTTDGSGYRLAPGAGGGAGHAAYGPAGTSFGRGDPPPPPVPDAATPYGAARSFAPPGSAPTETGGAAPPARALPSARDREWSGDDSDGSGSGLWAPDRRADEDDTGGVGWLWSVEDHGASPQVPRSWVREFPRTPTHDVDGQARPVEGRRLRQLESRSHGRRARHAKRWPVVMAVAAWLVLFAVVCWLYVFPWLEGILPENF